MTGVTEPDAEASEERYDTPAEAVLAAMSEIIAEHGGGTITIHEATCASVDQACTCEPITVSVPQEMPCSV